MSYTEALKWIIAVFGIFLLVFLVLRLLRKKGKQLFVIAVFLMGALLYYPVAPSIYPGEGPFHSMIMSAYHSLRLFLIDGDFKDIQSVLQAATEAKALSGEIAVWYERIALALFIIAPLSVATVIISFFKSATAKARLYTVGLFRRLYVFSELNDRSLALAKEIRGDHRFSTIVFCDVYRKNDEANTELTDEAEKISALCLENDVLHIRAGLFCRTKEYFIIGEGESENLGQAISLTKKYCRRSKFRIYVWARNPESACILDTVQKNMRERRGNKETSLTDSKAFKLRRIDDIEIFAWNTMRDADLFSKARHGCFDDGKGLISILIVGMGDYGMEFLKTAVWMYQSDNIHLEINAVDLDESAKKRLWHQCPELMKNNDCTVDGEAQYSIRFIENTDVFMNDADNNSSFENLLLSEGAKEEEMAQRLRRTTAVFVTLGDDDTNIRAALEIRSLFDRAHFEEDLRSAVEENAENLRDAENLEKSGGSGDDIKKLYQTVGKTMLEASRNTSCPEIYTPVYDIVKTENITLSKSETDGKEHQLYCYEDIPYNIHFKGSFKEQYNYATVTREELEREALEYHTQWAKIEEEKKALTVNYELYEYYRRSSMAQAIHKKLITDVLKVNDDEREQVIEHMRWNAFMMTDGYINPAIADQRYRVKLPRAKIHCDLVSFDKLDQKEKDKDSTVKKS